MKIMTVQLQVEVSDSEQASAVEFAINQCLFDEDGKADWGDWTVGHAHVIAEVSKGDENVD